MKTREKVIIKEYNPKRFACRGENNQVLPKDGKCLLGFVEGFRQFLNEARALENAIHPNVLDMHDFFHANNTAYLVSQDKGGLSLKWFMERSGRALDQPLLGVSAGHECYELFA